MCTRGTWACITTHPLWLPYTSARCCRQAPHLHQFDGLRRGGAPKTMETYWMTPENGLVNVNASKRWLTTMLPLLHYSPISIAKQQTYWSTVGLAMAVAFSSKPAPVTSRRSGYYQPYQIDRLSRSRRDLAVQLAHLTVNFSSSKMCCGLEYFRERSHCASGVLYS